MLMFNWSAGKFTRIWCTRLIKHCSVLPISHRTQNIGSYKTFSAIFWSTFYCTCEKRQYFYFLFSTWPQIWILRARFFIRWIMFSAIFGQIFTAHVQKWQHFHFLSQMWLHIWIPRVRFCSEGEILAIGQRFQPFLGNFLLCMCRNIHISTSCQTFTKNLKSLCAICHSTTKFGGAFANIYAGLERKLIL